MQKTIKATNETIRDIVEQEIARLGNDANLNHIDVSEVTDMSYLFYRRTFNGNVSQWDISKVENMSWMFTGCSFDGDLESWKFLNDVDMGAMFIGSPLEEKYGTDGKRLKTHNGKRIIWATNSTIKGIIREEIGRLGLNADLNHIDVSSVTNMDWLFAGLDWDGDISN